MSPLRSRQRGITLLVSLILLVLITLLAVPTAAWFGVRYRWAERLLVIGGFLSSTYLVDINLVSMESYRGDTRGFEFGLTDWMVIALIVTMFFMSIAPRPQMQPSASTAPKGSWVQRSRSTPTTSTISLSPST